MQVFFIVQGKGRTMPTSRTLREAGFRISSALSPDAPKKEENGKPDIADKTSPDRPAAAPKTDGQP